MKVIGESTGCHAETTGTGRVRARVRPRRAEASQDQKKPVGSACPESFPPLYAGILIGGASSRMGFPKHLIETVEGTLIERTVGKLRPFVKRVCLIGAGKVPASLRRMGRIADVPARSGPLAGMTAAFARHPRVAWLVIACDMPRLSEGAVKWLVSQRRDGRAAVIPQRDSGALQPLLAIYEPACFDFCNRLATNPRTGPRAVADLPNAFTPVIPPRFAAAWTNINRPQDLKNGSRRGAELVEKRHI